MKVAYKITADDQDVTSIFKPLFKSIVVIDEAGTLSDTAEITISDPEGLVALPKTGARLNIALGFKDDLTDLGTFVVDDISGEFAPETMTITAKAADMLGPLSARKTRSWHEVTVGAIVAQIAAEHGLTPRVSPGLQGAIITYQSQSAESDLAFLTRIARDFDAIAKPAGGYLIFAEAGAGLTATGAVLPTASIKRSEMRAGQWTIAGRGKYSRVIAIFLDRETARIEEVAVGSGGGQELTLRRRYASRAEAERAATAALTRSQRGSASIRIDLAGFWGDLTAGALVELTGIRPDLAGPWTISRAEHRLTSALTTTITAERDNPEI